MVKEKKKGGGGSGPSEKVTVLPRLNSADTLSKL